MSKTKTFTAANDVPFLVRIVEYGDRYGYEDRITHDKKDDALVEFYDYRRECDYDYPGTREEARTAGAPLLGQFVARYRLSTLLENQNGRGLSLMGSSPAWTIDVLTMQDIYDYLLESAPETESEETVISPSDKERQLTQMGINFDFLLNCINIAHAALSKRTTTWQERATTWQERATQVVSRAKAAAAVLHTITHTPHIIAYLQEQDPQALHQCEEVFK